MQTLQMETDTNLLEETIECCDKKVKKLLK